MPDAVMYRPKKAAAPAPAPKKKKKKKEKSQELEIPQVDILREGRRALKLQKEAAPVLIDIEEKYGPRGAQAEVATALARGEAEAAGIAKSGTAMREAILKADPTAAAAVRATDAALAESGPSEAETTIRQQTLDNLKTNGRLNAEQTREADQSIRAGLQLRGLNPGLAGVTQEALNRVTLTEQRAAINREAAAGADVMSQQRRAGDIANSQNALAGVSSHLDPQMRLFGTGGSAVSSQTSAPGRFQNALAGAVGVAQGNQQTALTAALAKVEDRRSREFFAAEQAAAAEYNAQSMSANSAALAANKKAQQQSTMVTAGAGVAMVLAIAF